MKKFMALMLVAMMVMCNVAVFAEDAVVTEETTVTDVELIAEDAGETTVIEEPDATVIILQINNKNMFINDDSVELGVPAQLINDRTMVPLRAIFEALDAQVEWDNDTETVTAYRGNVSISLQIGSTSLFVNRVLREIDVPAQLVNDRTIVPVRAVSEAFGCAVTWDEATETVVIMALPVEETVEEEIIIEETEKVVDETVIAE